MRTFLVALATMVMVATPSAHPGAASDVVVEIQANGDVDVLLTTSPESLLLKLRALADSAPPSDDIVGHRRVLVERMRLTVDDKRVELAWVGLEAPESIDDRRAGKIVARMRAAISRDARALRFQTGLIFGSYPLIVRRDGEPDTIEWLQGAESSAPIDPARPAPQSVAGLAVSGVILGFAHIVPKGLDHLLFILGLFLLTPRLRALLLQVSVFTIAHTLTLAASALGVISLPATLVEPLIALSIVFVGVENVVRSAVSRWRLGLVFLFGLLHGMGFAGALASHELSQSSFLTTLVSFNIGVELAQIAVLVAAAAIVRVSSLGPARYQRLVVRPVSLTIAAIAVVWTVQRIAS